MSENYVKISGTLSKDPTIRYTAAGLCWAQWTTVVEAEGKKGRAYIPCKAFGEVAQELEKVGKAEIFVTIEGRIATGSYTAKDGRKVFTVDVIAEKVDFSKGLLPSKEDKASVPEGFQEVISDDMFPF